SHDVGECLDIAPVEGIYPSLDHLHVLPRHRLPPFLSEAFGGSTGLVDVEVARHPYNLAVCPEQDPSPSLFNSSVAADQATVFPEGDEHHAVAGVENPPSLGLVVLPRPPPVLKEASNRRRAVEGPEPRIRHIEHRVES